MPSSLPTLFRRWLPLFLFAILWFDLLRQLSYMWEANEQYAFGWFVPILALGLLWRRWQARPVPQPGDSPRWAILLMVLCALVYLPARVIHEVNQDWALFSWLLTLSVAAVSLYAVFLKGGWPWVRHFIFPLSFIFTAVRWPYRVENSLTYRLMGLVTTVTTESLNWLGIPAAQHGHLIEVSTGTLGVDEACSGIRSLQSSIMAALLLGELYRLRLWARAALVGIGVLLAFGFNVARTMFLAWQSDAHGLSAIDKWHDPAGFSILVACFFVLWAIALLVAKHFSVSEPAHQRPANNQQPSTAPGRLPRWFVYSLAAWTTIVLLGTELWYRSGEKKGKPAAEWQANFPTNMPGAQEIPITRLVKSKLNFDHATTLAWQEPDDSRWSAYYFRWDPKATSSSMSALDHRPEYCLGGSGYNCRQSLGIRHFQAHGLDLPFRTYVFDRAGVTLYVFHCIWEDGAEQQEGFGSSKYRDRLRPVLNRKRHLGQQTLEIIATGYQDMAVAEKALRHRLPSLLKVENGRN